MLLFCALHAFSLASPQATSRTLAVTLHFSAQTSAAATQAALEARLEKKRKRRYGAPAGRRLLLFVDDVSMPSREPASGAQPPIELLRHFQDFRWGVRDKRNRALGPGVAKQQQQRWPLACCVPCCGFPQ